MTDLIRRYLAPQAAAIGLTAALLLISIGLRLVGPQLARTFIDSAIDGAPQPLLTRLAVAFIGASLAAQTAKILAEYWSDRVAWSATNGLRLDLTAHLLSLDASFYRTRSPGELIERVDGDVANLAGLFSSLLIKLAGSLLLLIGVLAALFITNILLGLAFGVMALVIIIGLERVRRLAIPGMAESREQSAKHYGFLGEVLAAAEDLRSSNATPYVLDRFSARLRRWMPVALRAEVLGALVWSSALGAFALVDGAAYGLGGWLYLRGAIPLGTVYMVIAYAAMLAQPIEMLRSEMQRLQQAQASLARVQELFSQRSKLVDGTAALPPGPLEVELDQLSFAYEGQPVLQGVSLKLAPGRRLGLLGRTGSGKSTIARLLFRMYDPIEGAVRLGGIDLRDARLRSIRSRVGLVTQEVQLFAATLRENLTFFDYSIADERLAAILEELGLGDWLRRQPKGLDTPISPASLSAGEAQLLAFARLFLQDPGLVILDEASSRLDPATEALLERAMARLLDGRTAIIIAHRLATVEVVDEIIILEDGRMAEHGERAALAAQPDSRYAQLRQIALEEVLQGAG